MGSNRYGQYPTNCSHLRTLMDRVVVRVCPFDDYKQSREGAPLELCD